MPHGQPDFGMYSLARTIYHLADMGELAVRLGSIVTHDRRGNVIWLDDFENDISKWWVLVGDAGYTFTWTAERSRSKGFSAKLTPDTDDDDSLTIATGIFFPATSRVGLELSLLLHDNIKEVVVYFMPYDGTNRRFFALHWVAATRVLSINTSGAVWTPIDTNFYLWAGGRVFSTLKLVIDLTTMYYVRAIANRIPFDLSAFTCDALGFPGGQALEVRVQVIADGVGNPAAYLDNVIITQNEP